MKKLSLPFLLLICSFSLYAQAPFEGKVTHKLTAETESKSGTIEIFYGKKMIKGIIRQNDDKKTGKDDLLLDFNKGLAYHLNAVDKTYRIDSMTGKTVNPMSSLIPLTEKNKVKLGMGTSAFTVKDTASMNLFGKMTMEFWYADSLWFPIEDKYLGSDESVLFTNGKTIGMGLIMNFDLGESKKIFELEPVMIEPGNLPDSLFEIPGDFTIELNEFPIIPDSLRTEDAFMMDSISTTPVAPAKKIIKKKTPAKPTRSKQPVKSKTAIRKE